MGLWEKHVVPSLVNRFCSASTIERQRRKIVPQATGRVLEIGIGSGFNLPFYDVDAVEEVWGLDPSAPLRAQAAARAQGLPFPTHMTDYAQGRIPADPASFDTVVVTYTLCSIPNLAEVLADVRRVMRPEAALLFSEHGRAPDAGVHKVQRLMTPVWRRLGGGCHLGRDIPGVLREAGFEVPELESMYLPGPRFLNFNYWGRAVPA
jgi:SAM-dependent methyltransferase